MVRPEKANWRNSGTRLLHQRPVAALDLKHPKGREVEAQVIARRHVDDATGADEILRLLDLVAHLCLVEAAGAFCGLRENHQTVIGVAAEGRDRLASLLLVSPRVGDNDRLLRV